MAMVVMANVIQAIVQLAVLVHSCRPASLESTINEFPSPMPAAAATAYQCSPGLLTLGYLATLVCALSDDVLVFDDCVRGLECAFCPMTSSCGVGNSVCSSDVDSMASSRGVGNCMLGLDLDVEWLRLAVEWLRLALSVVI